MELEDYRQLVIRTTPKAPIERFDTNTYQMSGDQLNDLIKALHKFQDFDQIKVSVKFNTIPGPATSQDKYMVYLEFKAEQTRERNTEVALENGMKILGDEIQ